jgi:hypothetical protein
MTLPYLQRYFFVNFSFFITRFGFFQTAGCQIFLGTIYQNGFKKYKNGGKYTNWPKICIPNGHKINQMAKNKPNGQKYAKWP